MLRCDLQKTFERLDEIQDPDPNTVVELGIRKSLRGTIKTTIWGSAHTLKGGKPGPP